MDPLPLSQTRVPKQLPYSAKRNSAATVPPTLQSNAQSLIWACSSSPETTSRPLTSFSRTCPPRFVPTSPVRVLNAPESPAHTPTPRNACELPAETIAAIACHISTKKIGWLNKWRFMKLAYLLPDVKVLVGGKDGSSSSKRA
jgi:hypothetical protein